MQAQGVREREAGPLPVAEYRPSTLRYILFHHRVLRVGWGLLLFAGLYWVVTLGQTLFLLRLHRFPRPSSIRGPQDLLLPQLLGLISVVVATIVPSFFEQRRVGQYGFESDSGGKLFVGGILSGLGVLSVLVLTLRQLGFITLSVSGAWAAGAALRQGAIWAGVYGVLGLLLNMLLRGYPQYTLTRGFAYIYRTFFLAPSGVTAGFWTAAFLLCTISALLQTFNSNESPIGLIWNGSMTFLFCLSLWRTGSLWWAIGFQTAWDWAQSFLFGLPDSGLLTRDHLLTGRALAPALQSGGNTGPEGSLLTIGAFVLMLGAVLLLKKRSVYPDLWQIAEAESSQRASEAALTEADPVL